MARTIAIHQPNYLPWLGYFRKIAMSDVFVFFDNAQMPRRKSYVSRNEIRGPQGRMWLTVPIAHGPNGPRDIAETVIANRFWVRKHLKTIESAYAKAPFVDLVDDVFRRTLEAESETIADLNISMVTRLTALLGIDHVTFARASTLPLSRHGGESIPEILACFEANVYLTGQGTGTMRYLDPDALAAQGTEVRYVPSHIQPYPQTAAPFEPNLSIVDALLNCGPERTRQLIQVP